MYDPTHSITSGRSEGDVTVRLARESDVRSLLRLAALDSATLPTGPTLVAEMDNELVAAVPVGGGVAIADPFHRTALLIQMLELRARQLHARAGSVPSVGHRARGFARAVLAR